MSEQQGTKMGGWQNRVSPAQDVIAAVALLVALSRA